MQKASCKTLLAESKAEIKGKKAEKEELEKNEKEIRKIKRAVCTLYFVFVH